MTTMDVPPLVSEALGEESITGGVSLGDEDAVCFTPTRTLVYRADGLLSDEGVSKYPHEFERLAISEGRRKTKFTLTYVDDERSFTVPPDRTERVLEQLLEGTLRATGPLEPDESVAGVFRFSELTLVVTDAQLLKHLGAATWAADFEAYHYDDVNGLEFEEGSVATAVVLQVDGRPERIKAPNDAAPHVRQTLQSALFAYHDVESLGALNDTVAVDSSPSQPSAGESASGEGALNLEAGIDPLTGGGEEDSTSDSTGSVDSPPVESPPSANRAQNQDQNATPSAATPQSPGERDRPTDVQGQIEELTAAVERQNELLASHQELIEQLIGELKEGR
jgi:hypothetical protein